MIDTLIDVEVHGGRAYINPRHVSAVTTHEDGSKLVLNGMETLYSPIAPSKVVQALEEHALADSETWQELEDRRLADLKAVLGPLVPSEGGEEPPENGLGGPGRVLVDLTRPHDEQAPETGAQERRRLERELAGRGYAEATQAGLWESARVAETVKATVGLKDFGVGQVHSAKNAGRLPYVRVGTRYYFRQEDVEEFILNQWGEFPAVRSAVSHGLA